MLIRRVTHLLRSRSRALALLLTICASLAIVTFASLSRRKSLDVGQARGSAAGSDDEVDAQLERAAREALGDADGTVVVMDPQTGRLRAVVNPRMAFNEAYAPGSAIKPFTALAALRRQLIDERTRRLCRTRYAYKELSISCPHQKTEVSFNLSQALAYSCNYFFGKVGERLETNTFDETLSEFGFGTRTGASADEAAGTLPQGEWRVSYAIGESGELAVTPVQLITAYSALVNGGRLFVPRPLAPGNFQMTERAQLTIAPEHRAPILEGMRGAVRYGTASSAGLTALPFEVFGKTGTSTMANDYRSQGWFVGFAGERGGAEGVPPESVKLAVLVFLKRSRGADCARVARSVFEEYAKRSNSGGAAEGEKLDGENGARTNASLPSVPIRVHLTGKNITRDLPLEEYVLGVVAAEGSVEDELEALKALAVAARTYALKNLRRHVEEGYDFCDTTHCQRYLLAVADDRNHARFKNLFKRAVTETACETLRDEEGRVADAYFHAACGGMTADIETLWGSTDAPGYLRGVEDEFCAAASHPWVNVIPAAKLAKALRGDRLSDVGDRLENVTVTSRDRTGRAEFLLLEGEGTRRLRGWDFKMIVGRALGWNILKSSRFEVTRAGSDFIFRGNGFGHGLGLCQEGAHEMARRGLSYRRILEHYFPGTKVG